MKTLAKIKFWSLLGFGLFFLFTGTFLLVTKRASQGAIEALLIAGMGQLVIFYILLFILYKGKLKNARKD
ncbi:hypothetical protein ACFLQX_00060 [Bacteroidota bacterium]